MNLTINNTATVATLTGYRLNIVTLAGQPGPPGAPGTGAGGGGGSFSGDLTIPYNTVVDAISLFNQTQAVNTGNAYSPFIEQQGFSWKTAAGGSSVPLEFRYGVKPERRFQGGGSWVLEGSLNSGAWITGLQVDDDGSVIVSDLFASNIEADILRSHNIVAVDGPIIFQSTGSLNQFSLSTMTNGADGNVVLSAPGPASILTILADSTVSGTAVPTERTVNTHPLTGDVTVTASDIPVSIAPGAGFSNLQQFINTMHSPGLIDGAIISDIGSGNARISPGTGMLRITDDNISSLLFVSMTGTTIAVPQDLTQYYVGFVYNSGNPVYQMRAANNWDNDTEIALGTVVNFFGTIIVSNNPYLVGDPITNIIQRFDAMAPITRDQQVGGLNLGEIGTRNIVLSAGKLWTRLNDYSVPAMNTAASDVMYAAYYNGFYWNYLTNVTQWDNTSYNDVTQGLVPVSIGYYTNLWFYLTVESNSLGFIYDQAQYGDLTSASLATQPSFLPPNFTNGSILLGRLLFHQGATVADRIDSAFVATFSSSPITSHNQLAGLQGGTTNEYYHLSQSDYAVLTGRAGSPVVHTINGMANNPIIGGAQGISIVSGSQTIIVSGQDWALNANLTDTGVALGERDTLLSGIASSALAATGSQLATSLTATGVTLGARDTLLSGIATTGLTNTGAALYNLITNASGVANLSYATIAQYTGLSGALGTTGSTLDIKINGLSGFMTGVSGTLQAIINAGGGVTQSQLNSLSGWSASATNLFLTGSGLYRTMTGMSGALVALIGASAAGVASLNGASGVLNLGGAGNVTVTTVGQNITISGNTGDYALFALKTDLGATGTALLARDLLTSGVQTAALALTGSNLYALTTGLSGQAVSTYATLGSLTQTGTQLGTTIALTGSGLFTTITGMSGAFNTALSATGSSLAARDTLLSGIATTGLTTSGTALYNLITSLSGQTTGTYATIPSLTTTGVTLGALIATTGQAAWVSANGAAATLSGNLTSSGAALTASSLIISGVLATGLNALSGFTIGASGALQALIAAGGSVVRVTGSSNLALVDFTGMGTNTISIIDGQIVISGSAALGAGVPSVNGITSAVTFVGTGGLQVTSAGSNIYVSGLTTATGRQVIFMNKGGVLSGDSAFLWNGDENVLTVNGNRLSPSGIAITRGDKLTVGTGLTISESGLTFQGANLGGGGTLSVTGLAGYAIASIMQSGIGRAQTLVGPALWSKQMTAVVPQTTTAVTVYGNTAATIGTISTISTEVLGQYTNFLSAATPFVTAGSSVTTAYYFRGSVTGRNGFFFTSTFCLADGNNITGAYGQPSGSRIFVGMTDATATTAVTTNDPAGNRVGLSYIVATGGTQTDRYDTDWLISAKDNSTQFTGSAGMNFMTGFYRFSMYAPPFAANNTGVYWQLDDLIRGSGTAGVITGRLPVGSTQLRPSASLCTVSGGAHNIRVNNLYVENAGAT